MNAVEYMKQIVANQKRGIRRGIYSVCSANLFVIQAAVLQGLEDNSVVLIESTCNQVNQFGGYTGMTPEDFRNFVHSITRIYNLSEDKLIIGGDHIGTYPFRNENYDNAMSKTCDMIRSFVRAGCSKIHIDASYRVADDIGGAETRLAPSMIAERCAILCAEAEEAYEEYKSSNIISGLTAPVYVIGTEVPAPGGSEETEPYQNITTVSDFEETLFLTKQSFSKLGLDEPWERVIAIVVEPGVEHGDHTVLEYNREKVRHLKKVMGTHDNLVFEAHTTDYQTPYALKHMVEDGFAILKTGQCQTSAAREAVFMLNYMENELLGRNKGTELSLLIENLDRVMTANPKYWQNYYEKDNSAFQRKYSFFDRQRYYWGDQAVIDSLQRLITNLRSVKIPLSLISQFMPGQYEKIRDGLLSADPEDLIRDRIMDNMRKYSFAVGNRNIPG
jgi:D-tagatose-1,6-bisphosphate aldolase subunit GatZ/KbaZ